MPSGIYPRTKRTSIKKKEQLDGIAKWLYSRGGRTAKDLLKDKNGLFVLMGDGYKGLMKVYLPK